jgi:membrane protein
MAAGVSYYAVLSLFPLLLALIGILGIFLPSETVQKELFDFFRENLPGAIDQLEDNIEAVIRLRGALGLLGVIGLLWSASAMFGAISRAVNRAWDVHKDRPIYIRKLRDLSMALGTGVLFLLSLGATGLFSIIGDRELPGLVPAVDVLARFFGFFMSLAIFLVIYKFLPNTKTYWRYVWPGAVLAAVLFEIAKSLFVFYLDYFADYQAVYGSVGSVIALLVWIYFSAFILILGAEFSSEYGRMREGVDRGVLLASRPSKDEQAGAD